MPGKRFREARSKVDSTRRYSVDEAFALLKETSNAKFDESIDMAVRLLEGSLSVTHAGPAITLIDADNVDTLGPEESLAPASFKPTFTVEQAGTVD